MFRKSMIIAAMAATVAQPAFAAPEKYEFDKTHTHIIFMIDHLGFSKTIGRFRDFDGHFTFDQQEPEKSGVEVTIRPGSVDTNVPELDKKLAGEKFFNVEKFPAMTFKSTAVKVTGEKSGTVTGDFTMLGVTKPVTLEVTFNNADIHPYTQKYVAGFSIRTRLKRSDFGMGEYIPAVGDEVTAIIEVEGVNNDKKPEKLKK